MGAMSAGVWRRTRKELHLFRVFDFLIPLLGVLLDELFYIVVHGASPDCMSETR